VSDITATISDRGDGIGGFFLQQGAGVNTFVPALRNSKKMRAEIDLPWAGRVLLEFNTSGADRALNAIPCGDNQPATAPGKQLSNPKSKQTPSAPLQLR